METLRSLRWVVACPKNALWACAYLVLLGLKPHIQQQIEKYIELAPADLLLAGFGLVMVYVFCLPKGMREQFKDLCQGGEARLQARKAIDTLKASLHAPAASDDKNKTVLLSILGTAMILFQAGDYEDAAKTALSALQTIKPEEETPKVQTLRVIYQPHARRTRR